jgi:hypothetical protein
MSGTEFLEAVEKGSLDPFPKYQRFAAPSRSLVESLETDARIGFLCFMFPVRKKEIGDGLRRIQVLQTWAADEEKKPWLDVVQIVLSNYDHLSRKDFVDLYVRMNGNAKKHTPGDFCKAYQHLLDDEVVKFLNRSEFLEDGDWFPYTKSNAHWNHAVVIQYGLEWAADRDAILDHLSKTEGDEKRIKTQHRTAAETVKHLERTYKLLTAMRKLKAKSTTSKWAVAMISDALDRFPGLLNVTVDVMLHAWDAYLVKQTGQHRQATPETAEFLNLIPGVMKQMAQTVGTV